MKNKIWLYWFIPLIVSILYIDSFLRLNTNLITVFDEGFYYLSIWKIKHGIINEGLSLWALMVDAICSEKITSSILNLRYVRFFFQITSIGIFAIISLFYLVKKKILDSFIEYVLYLSLVFWLGYSTLGDKIITYNELQSSFLSLIIGLFLLSTVYQTSKRFLLYIIIGFFSFLSFVTIPPSGVLISISILILLGVQYWSQKKKMIYIFLFFLLGFIISALCIHFFILDLKLVFHNMLVSTNKISNSNRGYDPISLAINLMFYFRDFFIITCLLLGVSFLYINLNKFTKYWVACLFFLFSVIILVFYQKKPIMALSTIWAFPFLLFVLWKFTNRPISSINSFFTFDVLIKVFLFLSPLISAIGTNTDLSGKMILFILPWSVLFAELFNGIRSEREKLKWIVIVCLSIMIFQPVKTITIGFKTKMANYYFNEYKPISGIKLNKPQFEYFNRINQIFKNYSYKAEKDVIFATTFDHMTICAFDAIPCETYQVPNDFIGERDKNKLAKPDFIFLDKYDYDMMSDSIKSLGWGFPEDYDKYFVGTPDQGIQWDNQRWLYCLKVKRNLN